jgi:ubiquinol-cytochrome c reductase cytochrome b subunit
MGNWRRFTDALDDRTGYRAFVRAAADEPVRGGARFAYVFGSALVFTFILQAVTGVVLATAYSPSVTDAWASVYYIQNQMTLGWLVRGIHHFGSSAMIVLCVIHMTQVFVYGAYRAPREVNWLIGLVMLLLVLGFGLTGYLLPWDQKGYWATKVATSIVGGVPGGGPVQELLQGGVAYGNLTLTRFYAIHVFILPFTLILLMIGHMALFRRHGVTPSPARSDEELGDQVEMFWPYQMLKDIVFAFVVLGLLVACAVFMGADLDAPANPAGGYEARPEWYFLFLFQLLKYFEGPMVLMGTVVIPGLAVGFLFAIPFLERSRGPERTRPSARIWVPFLLIFLGAGGLTAISLRQDATDKAFQKGRQQADLEAENASVMAASGGIDAEGRVIFYEAARLFEDKGCAGCHAADAVETKGPLLHGFGTLAWIERFMRNPDDPSLFGGTVLETGMEAFEGNEADLKALVAWLGSLSHRHKLETGSAEILKRGREVYGEHECGECHNSPDMVVGHKEYDIEAFGPDLAGYLSSEWVRALIRNSAHPAYFGGALEASDLENAMPDFEDLSNDELSLLVSWLLAGAPGAE